MALTQSAWSEKTVNAKLILTCTVEQTASENDNYTLKTPKSLDTELPWTLIANATGEALDAASTMPLEIWGGYADDFVITGNAGTLGATSGALVGSAVGDDMKSGVLTLHVDPGYVGTRVASTLAGVVGIINCGTFPYYAFNGNAGTTLTVGKINTWIIIQ